MRCGLACYFTASLNGTAPVTSLPRNICGLLLQLAVLVRISVLYLHSYYLFLSFLLPTPYHYAQ